VAASSNAVRGLRWTAAALIALIAAVLVVSSVVARFARGELLDTDRYVATVAPLASDPQVQVAVVDRVTDEIMARLPIEQLTTDLAGTIGVPDPDRIADLATPAISSWLNGQVHNIVNELVTSPEFVTVWQAVNRTAHQSLNALLTGQGQIVSTSGADVVVNLGPVVDAAKQAMVQRGFTLAEKIPQMSIPYTVAQIDGLPEIQQYVRWLDTSATWLPVLAIVLLALAAWTAPNHRRGLITGLMLSAVLLTVALIANQVVRSRLSDRATQRGLDGAVAIDVYDTVVRYLISALATVLVAALLGVLWLMLAGPSRPATGLRRQVNRGLSAVAGRLGGGPGAARIGAFTRRWHAWIGGLIAVLAFWWLLASPTIATVLWAFGIAAVLAVLLALAQRLSGPAGSSDVAGPPQSGGLPRPPGPAQADGGGT
jgi:hypothetical protein